jgi:leucine dehydrogenase
MTIQGGSPIRIFDEPAFDDHEHVSFFGDSGVGLRLIVAIHRSGPMGIAGGGLRMQRYPDEQAAARDALRLSRAMTGKLALVGLPAGGAKAVLIGDPSRDKNEALLLAVGRAVDRLGGRFVVSEDAGIRREDLAIVARATPWVSAHVAGDDAAAYGAAVALRVAVRERLGRDQLDGIVVALQGAGSVGRALARRLAAQGARLVIADLDERVARETARELGARAVAPDVIFDQDADVFSPCALGGVIDERVAARLRVKVIAGAANNPLTDARVADALEARGILYAPDLVAGAGGVIGAAFGERGDPAVLRARLDALGPLLESVFARARREHVSTHVAAERLAREQWIALGGRP